MNNETEKQLAEIEKEIEECKFEHDEWCDCKIHNQAKLQGFLLGAIGQLKEEINNLGFIIYELEALRDIWLIQLRGNKFLNNYDECSVHNAIKSQKLHLDKITADLKKAEDKIREMGK